MIFFFVITGISIYTMGANNNGNKCEDVLWQVLLTNPSEYVEIEVNKMEKWTDKTTFIYSLFFY